MAKIATRISDISNAVDAENYTLALVVKLDKITADLTPAEIEDHEARASEFIDAVHALYSETFPELLAFAASQAAGSETKGGGATVKNTGGRSDAGAVREWARANGFNVGDRGRIHADVWAAYADANRAPQEVTPDVEVDGPTDAELAALAAELA